ncbi:BF3164 family lipoprotein [Alkalitalea saponilacus]|uniref:TolB-like 6-blade propeller-like n=1 Tax=Alkalitalea saponilacus TaxID=889453 RepID=A0A1T5EXK8_9BACT|nr:BF3164 family lipoprotein [Alkalitalea saponilacus]ASB47977.1 hypothetical protein CDL62_01815 [Alkalitalea saponilacus]SKB88683.1 TolB-like 6-blade propeller-like [Alkalitalea saponilacus]
MKLNILLIFGCVLFSCSSDYKNDLSNSTSVFIKYFPKSITLKAEPIKIELPGINHIHCMNNLLIGINYSGSNDFLHLYDKEDFSHITSLIARGKAPDEFLTLNYDYQWGKDSTGTYMWIKDINSNKLCKINLSKSIEKNRPVFDKCINNLQMDLWYMKFVVNDSLLVLTPHIQKHVNNLTLQHYNLLENRTIFERQLYKDNFSPKIDNQVYGLRTMIKPDGTKLLAFNSNFSRFHILNLNLTNNKTITTYEEIAEKEIKRELQRIELYDLKRYYINFLVTNQKIYALYANKYPQETRSLDTTTGVEVHLFNWAGDPLKKFIIKENLWQITIDEENKTLYGITANEQLYRYDLSDIKNGRLEQCRKAQIVNLR